MTRPAPEIDGAVRVEVGGQGFYAGKGAFLIEADDPLGCGFTLARSFGEARTVVRSPA